MTRSARTIPDNSTAGTVVTWVIAVLVCMVSVPLYWALPPELAKGNRMALLGLVFPLGGVGLVIYALRLTLAQWRFGRLAFEPDPDPAMIGGDLGGRIALPFALADEHAASLTLTCFRTTLTERRNGESDSTERSETVVWQREGRPVVSRGADASASGSMLLFRFALPRELPPGSGDPSVDGAHRWVLYLDIEAPGVSLHRQFDVPVARDGTVASVAIAQLPEASAHGAPTAIPPSVVSIARSGNDMVFTYPPLRDRGTALVCALVGLSFGASVWAFNTLPGTTVTTTVSGVSTQSAGGMPWFMTAIFVVAGLLLLLMAGFLLCNTLQVWIGPSSVRARRSVFGVGLWDRTLPRADIGDIVPDIAITSRGGGRPQVSYRLWAIPAERLGLDSSAVLQARREGRQMRKRLLVGVSLRGSAMMERVRAELKQAVAPASLLDAGTAKRDE